MTLWIGFLVSLDAIYTSYWVLPTLRASRLRGAKPHRSGFRQSGLKIVSLAKCASKRTPHTLCDTQDLRSAGHHQKETWEYST